MDYDALSFRETADVYMVAGVVGILVDLLILLSYFFVPNIKAQHPAANLVIWQAACGMMTAMGLVVMYVVDDVFFLFASAGWYLMLSLDLLVALVNPWMGYNCKSWAYHTMYVFDTPSLTRFRVLTCGGYHCFDVLCVYTSVWSFSGVSAFVVYQRRLYGVSAMNMCWLKRTSEAALMNKANWVFLYGEIIAIFALSLGVLLFASFRFVRRQLDVTYRAKRRNLMQYYRYLLIYGGYWSACGGLYYASYRESFQGEMARRIELAFVVVFGSYPVLLLIVWVLNTELYQNRSSENSLPKSERGSEIPSSTEHFSAALRKDLMRYTTAGICCSINDTPNVVDSLKSPLLSRSRANSMDRTAVASLSLLQMEENDSSGLYNEKKRVATTVYNGEYRYYEKLGFTDYAPKIFQNIREVCGIDNFMYEQSFADTLLERASEGKSGMLFYFTSDRKYLVKTMTKWEHSFLLNVLPLYHQYILKQPNSLLCRFLGCHSMQLPVGWNKMFFVVMENVFPDGPVDERYDLKGIFHQSNLRYQEERVPTPRWNSRRQQRYSGSGKDDEEVHEDIEEALAAELRYLNNENQPLLRRGSSRSSLRHDNDFVSRRASLCVNSATRANLLAQVTSDCGFLQELGIMDYSCLLGIRHFHSPLDPHTLDTLAHNAVVSEDQKTVYYLGFVDILQHYNFGWKVQHCLLSAILDKRSITALPPAEYALRFLSFIHEYLLRDTGMTNKRSYGSIGFSSPPLSLTIDRELTLEFFSVIECVGVGSKFMKNVSMEEELQHTLAELCDDLLSASTSLADANSILDSLTVLALQFPQAQKLLGRLLSSNHAPFASSNSSPPARSSRHASEVPTKLSVLANRFLYQTDTANRTIALLAALAKENSFNQQRMVRSVAGVRLARSSKKSNHARDMVVRTTVFDGGRIKKKKKAEKNVVLYALTVPDSIKDTYKKWRKRQRLLQNRRIPSGVPPRQGGVPTPCHCNECLGAEQFLATWQLHFQDLSRWTKDPEDPTSSSIDQRSSQLPSAAFFQIFLEDYRICMHDLVGEDERDAGDRNDRKALCIYYFVPLGDEEIESAPPVFDPLQHVCAIEIAPEVDAESRKHRSSSRYEVVESSMVPTSSHNLEDSAGDDFDCVILHDDRVELPSCTHARNAEVLSPLAYSGNGAAAGMSRFLIQVEENAGASISKRTFADFLREDEEQMLSHLDHKILDSVLDFFADDGFLELGILRGIVESDRRTAPSSLIPEMADTETAGASLQIAPITFDVRIVAKEGFQELAIQCSSGASSDDPPRVFSASVTRQQILEGDSSCSQPFALLCMDEEELRSLLGRCRVCSCSDLPPILPSEAGIIYLLPDPSPDLEKHLTSPIQEDVVSAEPVEERKPRTLKRVFEPVSGISDEVKTSLLHLETVVRHNSTSIMKTTFDREFSKKLSFMIKSCNTRITALAASKATSTIPEAHRKAGMERCRRCRDLLIQLGKKTKLVVGSSTSTTSPATFHSKEPLSAAQVTRIAKLIRSTVTKVQQESECFSAWETPDARVDKLQLSRRVWSSGFPDPEFYRENDLREQENKKRQRALTRKLLEKQQSTHQEQQLRGKTPSSITRR